MFDAHGTCVLQTVTGVFSNGDVAFRFKPVPGLVSLLSDTCSKTRIIPLVIRWLSGRAEAACAVDTDVSVDRIENGDPKGQLPHVKTRLRVLFGKRFWDRYPPTCIGYEISMQQMPSRSKQWNYK